VAAIDKQTGQARKPGVERMREMVGGTKEQLVPLRETLQSVPFPVLRTLFISNNVAIGV
jgi:hypothetical protein